MSLVYQQQIWCRNCILWLEFPHRPSANVCTRLYKIDHLFQIHLFFLWWISGEYFYLTLTKNFVWFYLENQDKKVTTTQYLCLFHLSNSSKHIDPHSPLIVWQGKLLIEVLRRHICALSQTTKNKIWNFSLHTLL